MNKFHKNALTIALGLSLTTIVNAQQNVKATEVDQLRAEVNELKTLLQQYSQTQQQQAVQLQQAHNENNQRTPSKGVTPSGLGLTVAGSEIKLYGNVRMDAQYQAEEQQCGYDAGSWNYRPA